MLQLQGSIELISQFSITLCGSINILLMIIRATNATNPTTKHYEKTHPSKLIWEYSTEPLWIYIQCVIPTFWVYTAWGECCKGGIIVMLLKFWRDYSLHCNRSIWVGLKDYATLFSGWKGRGRRERSFAPLEAKEKPLIGGAILRITPPMRGGSLVSKGAKLLSSSPKRSCALKD